MSDLLAGRVLLVEPWPPRGLGGQYVGTMPGVRVTDELTGIAIECSHERSQHRNLQIAKAALEGALTCPALR